MTSISATDAKNRLGQVLEKAQREPVFIEKQGRPHSVLMSVEHYEELLSGASRESAAQKKRRFYEQYKEWVDAQNRLIEQFGIPGEEYRPW
jgi:prevent-host-death family protein